MPVENEVIEPLQVIRDDMGCWTHPAWPDDGDECAILKSWFAEHGLEFFIVELENDNEELAGRWFEDGLCDCTTWEPTMPDGDGWFIFSIHDTEDGPICVWVRHSQAVSG